MTHWSTVAPKSSRLLYRVLKRFDPPSEVDVAERWQRVADARAPKRLGDGTYYVTVSYVAQPSTDARRTVKSATDGTERKGGALNAYPRTKKAATWQKSGQNGVSAPIQPKPKRPNTDTGSLNGHSHDG